MPEKTHHINNGRGRGVMLELRFAPTNGNSDSLRVSRVVLNNVGGIHRQLEVPLQRFGEWQGFTVNRHRLIALQPQQLNQPFTRAGSF